MYRKTITAILLGIVCCTSVTWAGNPNDYIIPGRAKLFDGTLSGVRQAYQTFTNGINDPNCSNNRELRFLHAAAGTAMLAIRDDGGSVNSVLELAKQFGINVLGDYWASYFEPLGLELSIPLNEHDAYEIPPGAPNADEIRAIFDTSMIPDVNSLIDDLKLISDSPPFTILLDPNETRAFFDPNLPPLQYDLEVDYGEVLLLKGFLIALKGQLQARSAYDLYVDPNDNLVEKLHNNSFNMNTDLLGRYPDFLKVLPTANDPNIGKAILAQARQDLIDSINCYFDAIDYIRNEGDPQEDDLLYIDPNEEHNFEVIENRLTILRDSLANDTVITYPMVTTKTYDVNDANSSPIGQLVLVYNFGGVEGNEGSLNFTGSITPSQWEVDAFGINDGNTLWVDVENYDGGWRMGYFEATLAADGNSFTAGTLQYHDLDWNWVTVNGLSGQLDSSEVVNVHVDLNPIFGSSPRYPNPVNPRDLLPEFDQWNGPQPGTMGHGLGADATLGGILPDMTQQDDWQVQLDLQPGALVIIKSGSPTIDGGISEWTPSQLVFDDISGDTENQENPLTGVDIDKLYLSYDPNYLYGAITLYDNIDNSIDYRYELNLSYSPNDDSGLYAEIFVSGGSASISWYNGGLVDVPELEAQAGLNAVEFRIPLAIIPGGWPGRFIALESWGWDSSTYEDDGEWNGTHLKIAGLGTSNLGTISGTVIYEDHISGEPIFVQAYTDPWDPEDSIVTSTMINAPGAYTLTGIGIGFEGYVRAFTPLFSFNIFDPEGLTIEASTAVKLTGPTLTGVNLTLGGPTTLQEDTPVEGQLDPNTYDENWYAFVAQKDIVYALDLTRLTSQNAYMIIYGRDGHTELEEAWGGGNWQHIDWTCPETGTYYITVSNGYYQPDGGTYQLRITEQDSMPSGYEVWGGDTDYRSEDNWQEYYYNIDKQDYVKLGESSGGSAIFNGDYAYYVIAVHEQIDIDSICGASDQFYYGDWWWCGNAYNESYITGPPDGFYATVGYQSSGGTFRGFLIIVNSWWDTLSVITSTSNTGSISGQVADPNGNKLANVAVDIYIGDDENIADEDAWNYYGSTTTDPNGQYRFDLLPQRRYRVHIYDQEVEGTHYIETDLYNVQVLAGSETINMNYSLKQAGLIYGYVKTAAGSIPIPNAALIAEAPWTDEGRNWHNVWTDSDGRYELWVAPSPGKFYPVWVTLAQLDDVYYESKWDGNLYQATLEGTHGPDYYLEVGGTVTGRVVNESGVGIEGVWVESGWSEQAADIGWPTETDPNGDFALHCLPSGINYICLDNREIQQNGVKYQVSEAYAGPIDIPAGGTVDVGTFTIYEAGMVTGIVTNESGVPVVAAEVSIDGRDINGNYSEREDEVTDSFGQFTIDYVAPGTYYLRTTKEGLLPSTVTNIVVARGQHVDLDDVILKSANEGATLSGSITNYADIAWYDSDHVQLPCYEESDYEDFGYDDFGLVAISMEHTYTESDYLDIDSLFVGMLDSEDIDDGYGDYFQADPNETPGSYQMMLPPGDIAIGMHTNQEFLPGWGGCAILHDWKRFNLTKGDSLSNVDFTAVTTSTGTLKGNITVPAGYNYFPEGWCSIYAYALDPNGNTINSIQLGDAVAFPGWTTTYEFRDLPAGTYRLKAYARNLASVIVPSVTVGIGGTTIQDITFTAGGTLSGQVTGGVAVSGAVVTIIETGKQATTDASGNYIIKGMNTGTYTVKASALGYADAQETVQVTEGSVTTQDFVLSSTVGSISGTVKDISDANVNGATVAAYNESDKTSRTCKTVGGAFSIGQLTPGQYILAVNTDAYGVVVYPEGANRITLLANQNITGININVGAPKPPVFTVSSSASTEPVVLSMTFYSDRNLLAAPSVEIVDGNGVKGSLTSNTALNRFEIDYTANANDNLVRIKIEETTPLVPGSPASKTFSFEVGTNLVMTSSTNVTNATGGTARIMGTQDNTEIYVPPFAIAGADSDSQAITLTIERYGDPGDDVHGTDANSVTAVYDFKFEDGVSVDENHTFTVTMSFQLPAGMTQQEFEDTLVVKYFDAGDQQWKTDGITNVRINWANSTIIFEVNHLSEFAGFTQSEIYHPADKNSDEVIGISEIVSYINKWAAGEVSISDVVKGINLWAAGHYYWDSSAQKFKPGTQP